LRSRRNRQTAPFDGGLNFRRRLRDHRPRTLGSRFVDVHHAGRFGNFNPAFCGVFRRPSARQAWMLRSEKSQKFLMKYASMAIRIPAPKPAANGTQSFLESV
jgi:hypothetical protein